MITIITTVVQKFQSQDFIYTVYIIFYILLLLHCYDAMYCRYSIIYYTYRVNMKQI